jgi:hypothetical protein
LIGKGEQLNGLAFGLHNGLFDVDMGATLQGGSCRLEMQMGGRTDMDDVGPGFAAELVDGTEHLRIELTGYAFGKFRVDVTDSDKHVGHSDSVERAQMVLPHLPTADDTNFYPIRHLRFKHCRD